jgi:surfeit locus 1 family protein
MLIVVSRCRRHWPIALLVSLLLASLVSLGLWQLARAQEKQTLLLNYQQLQIKPKVNLESLVTEQWVDYLPVYLQGKFNREHYWLLDNRSRNGRTGYEVVVPFIAGQHVVLVNIGWVVAAPERSSLPMINLPAAIVKVAGHLYTSQKNLLVNSGASDLTIPWPKRVLQIDWETVAQDLDMTNSGTILVTKIMRIDSEDPVALVTDWSPVTVQPAKHRAYAFQWFAMALALLILYGWYLKSAYPTSKKMKVNDN